MKTIKFLLPAIVILLSINKSSAQLYSATDSMTFTSQNNTVSDWGRGFLFYPNIDIYISKIGKLVPSNTGNYKWAIWDYNNQTIVYQQTSLQSYAGQYIYEPTDSIIKLTANTYYILILYSDSGSYYYDINSQFPCPLMEDLVMQFDGYLEIHLFSKYITNRKLKNRLSSVFQNN